MSKPFPKEGLLDDKLAAAWLGISPGTLRNMRCKGVGPRFVKLGEKLVRYRQQDLQAFADSQLRDPSAA